MTYAFIYVVTKEDRDAMLKRGFTLVQSLDNQSIWVFENSKKECFDAGEITYVFSNSLVL